MKFSIFNFQFSKNSRGFTLVELMVAVSLFAVIMVISMGSILSVFDANRKSQSLRTVMDNLNFTMEAMTRTIRFGSTYHCDSTVGDITVPRDCGNNGPATSLVFKAPDGTRVIYKLSGGHIARSINGGPEYFLTSSDMTIQSLTFRVFGSPTYQSGGDLFQPQVIIVISGFAGTKETSKSSFSLETTVSQRQFDSQ